MRGAWNLVLQCIGHWGWDWCEIRSDGVDALERTTFCLFEATGEHWLVGVVPVDEGACRHRQVGLGIIKEVCLIGWHEVVV